MPEEPATTDTSKQRPIARNRFKITPRGLAAIAVIAIGATFGTTKLMQSDTNTAEKGKDDRVSHTESVNWLSKKIIQFFSSSDEDIIATERAISAQQRKAAADFNRIGAYVALEVSDQIAANPAKFLGPQHNASEAIGLRNIVLRAQKGISEAERENQVYTNTGQYLTPNAPSSWGPSRTANVLFDSKAGELKIEVFGADGKLHKETTMDVTKRIALAKEHAANYKSSKP
jgi:hypothetical protein